MSFVRIKDGINLGSLTSDPVSANKGDIYFNVTTNKFRQFDGSTWESLSTESFVTGVVGALTTDDIPEGVTNKYFSDTLARTAAVVNSTAGSETDQAPSVSATKSYVSTELAPYLKKDGTVAMTGNLLPDGNETRNLGSDLTRFQDIYGKFLSVGTVDTNLIRDRLLTTRLSFNTAGEISVSNNKLTNVFNGSAPTDAVNIGQLDSAVAQYVPLTQKGAANGVATLDSGGKVPATQLPNSVMELQGFWNASTNTPTLIDGTGNPGDVWEVSVAGSQNLGSGSITFKVGDWAVYAADGKWYKSINSNEVTSVNGLTGTVNLTTDNVNEGTTNLYYTDSRALSALPQSIATTDTPQFQDVQVLGTGLGNRLIGKTLAQLSSTGVIKGLALSINTDPTKFDIAAGTYEIVDNYTDPVNPVVTPVTYAGSTANITTNLATAPASYILLDAAGAITQQTSYPTPSERRAKALIGRVTHQNNTVITFANSFPDVKNGIVSQFYDLCDAMAPFKIGGLSITTNGSNLSFNRSSGSAFFRSASWTTTPANPHTLNFSAQTLQPFRKMTQTTIVDGSDVTVVEPNYYDVGGTRTLNGGPNGSATIQRVYLYKSGGVRVAYGQTVYTNLATALSRINQDPFVPNPTIEQSAILIGYIVLTKDCTDLTNTNKARLLTAARFDAGGSVVAGGVTTLQQAYLNSVLPQIVLNSAQGAFTIDDAATPIGTLVDIRNNAGTTSFLKVNASGIQTTNFVGSGTSGAVRVHNLTTVQRNALTGANGMLVYDTDLNLLLGYVDGSWQSLDRELNSTGLALTAGASLAINTVVTRQTWTVSGSTGPVTLSTTPFGSTAPLANAEITLVCVSDANAVTIPVNDNTYGVIGYSVTLGKGQTVTYKYNTNLGRYVIKSVSN